MVQGSTITLYRVTASDSTATVRLYAIAGSEADGVGA